MRLTFFGGCTILLENKIGMENRRVKSDQCVRAILFVEKTISLQHVMAVR